MLLSAYTNVLAAHAAAIKGVELDAMEVAVAPCVAAIAACQLSSAACLVATDTCNLGLLIPYQARHATLIRAL